MAKMSENDLLQRAILYPKPDIASLLWMKHHSIKTEASGTTTIIVVGWYKEKSSTDVHTDYKLGSQLLQTVAKPTKGMPKCQQRKVATS